MSTFMVNTIDRKYDVGKMI